MKEVKKRNKPFHVLLRQYRVLQIFLTVFLTYITYKFSMWIMADPFIALLEWQIAVIVAAYPALLAGMFALVKSISERNDSDND